MTMTSRNLLTADWDWVLGQARQRYRERGPAPDPETAVIPCALVLTGKRDANGKILNVRCRCQAQTREQPRERFFGYDLIGEAASLAEAIALWRTWHEERKTWTPGTAGRT